MVRKIVWILTIPVTVFSCSGAKQSVLAQTMAARTLDGTKSAKQIVASTRFSFVEPKDSARYVLSVASEREYVSTATVYSDKIQRDTTTHRIVNNQLRLPLTNGKFYVARNDFSENDNYKDYKYEGQLTAINKYVVFCGGWEYSDYIMIDKQTGDTAIFFAEPKISPKNTRLAYVYYDVYQTDAQTIQVSTYRLVNKQIAGSHTTYIHIGDEQYPLHCTLVWENEQSILIELRFEKEAAQYLRVRMRK